MPHAPRPQPIAMTSTFKVSIALAKNAIIFSETQTPETPYFVVLSQSVQNTNHRFQWFCRSRFVYPGIWVLFLS